MNDADEWLNSKAQREALRQKFNGLCGYCGEPLKKMQADHIEPVIRLTTDHCGRPLPASDRRYLKPERNVVGNMMPSCPACNNSKGGYNLEGWRDLLKRSAEIVAKQKPIFKTGVRFGVIEVKDRPVVFHFERMAQNVETVHAAAPSHDAAVIHARELNKALHRKFKSEPNDLLCFSYAAPWPHDEASYQSPVNSRFLKIS